MRRERINPVAVLLWTILALNAATVIAQVNIEGPRSIQVSPGEDRTLEYTVTNHNEAQVEARIFFNDYAQRPDGSLQHIPAGSLPGSLFRIAAFELLEYLIPAGESITVPLDVTVPDEPLAGYWGVIGVEAPPPPRADGEEGVTFNIRYAMVTAVEIENLARHQLSIENISVLPSGDGQAIALTIRNSGNVYQRFDLSLTLQGGADSRDTETMGAVLPGLTIDKVVTVPSDLAPGSYGVFAVASYEDGESAEAVTTLTIPERQ